RLSGGLTMGKKCLECAKRQQIKGWRVAREAYSVLWPILINNKAATLELDEKQIQGLLDVTEEMTSIICGAEESGMNIAEYAEYITGKADECRTRLEVNLNEV